MKKWLKEFFEMEKIDDLGSLLEFSCFLTLGFLLVIACAILVIFFFIIVVGIVALTKGWILLLFLPTILIFGAYFYSQQE